MADDAIQLALEGPFSRIKQVLSGVRGVDYGCRCHLGPLPNSNVTLTVFVPSGQVAALQQAAAAANITVTVGRNASADSRAAQAHVVTTLPAGVSRLRGRGVQPSGSAAPDVISGYIDTALLDSEFRGLAANHPTLCSVIPLPNKSVQGRTVNLFRLGLQGSTKSRAVLFTACAHAREWGGAEICYGLASDLLEAYEFKSGLNYGSVSFTAAQVVQLLTTIDLFILPCINPDGRTYSMTPAPAGDPMWRRNRNNPPVDLNRNYDFLWNFRADFDPKVADGTYPNELFPPAWDDPNDIRYGDLFHGPSPVSEPECKNVVWVFDQYPQIGSFVDIHSYSGDFLYSWGNAPDQAGYPATNFSNSEYNGKRGVTDESVYAEYISPEDQFIVQAMANNFTDMVKQVRGSAYFARQDFWLTVGNAAGQYTYPTSGAVDDYAFSRKQANKPKVYSFTLEFGLESNFHPAWPEMGSIIEEIDAGLVSFCLNPPDPCAYLEQQASDLENQLQTLMEAFADGEIPEPRTPKNIAGVQAEIRKLRMEVVAANKAAQTCRSAAPHTIAAVSPSASPTPDAEPATPSA